MRHDIKIKLYCLSAFLIVACPAAVIYLVRAPVVIAVDDAYLELYGKKRAQNKRITMSLMLLRQVKFAIVASDADQDSAGLAVTAVSKKPFIVIFPERYKDGAERYAAAAKEAGLDKTRIVSISGGEAGVASIGAAESLRIDRETDLYRAGHCAALLAKGSAVEIFSQGALPESQRRALVEGLAKGGHTDQPVFRRSGEQPSKSSGCVVLLAPAGSGAIESMSSVPLILFSWIDPSYTPRNTAVVFDDSQIAAAMQAVRRVASPVSEIRVLPANIPNKITAAAVLAATQSLRYKE